jgi:hypothetical protein
MQAEIGISKHQGGLPATAASRPAGRDHHSQRPRLPPTCAGGCALRDPTTRASGIME